MHHVVDAEMVLLAEVLVDQRFARRERRQRRRGALLEVDLEHAVDGMRVEPRRVRRAADPTDPRRAGAPRRDELDARYAADGLPGLRRDRVEAVGVLEDEVPSEVLVDRVVETGLQPRGEHRDERDQGQADHQRGGCDRGASRIAHRVLARQLARQSAQADERRARHARKRPDGTRAEDRGAEEDEHRPEPDQAERAVRVADPEQAVGHRRDAEQQENDAEDRGPRAALARRAHPLAQRLERRHARGAYGRRQ